MPPYKRSRLVLFVLLLIAATMILLSVTAAAFACPVDACVTADGLPGTSGPPDDVPPSPTPDEGGSVGWVGSQGPPPSSSSLP